MKLADWLFKQRLTPQHVQRTLGVSSRSTVMRYLIGERTPQPINMQKIERLTGKQVTLDDFIDKPPPECAAFIVDAKDKRRMVLPWSIYDKRLDMAFEAMLHEPREASGDSPAATHALSVLGHRARRSGAMFIVDKNLTDTRGLIRAANQQLACDLLPTIRYPGV